MICCRVSDRRGSLVRHVAFLIGALACCMAISASAARRADASSLHVPSADIGAPGEAAGDLASPKGVAVNQETHDVYVADTGNARIDEFSANGTFLRAWGWGVADGLPQAETCVLTCQKGLTGAEPGEFEAPAYVSVDNSTGPSRGDLYVGDTGTALVQKFEASGALVESWGDHVPANGQLSGAAEEGGPFQESLGGITVDTLGNLWVYDTGERMYEFDQAAGFIRTWFGPGSVNEAGIAIDGAEDLYVVGAGFGALEKVTENGELIGRVTPAVFEGGEAPTGVAVDPATNDLYVDVGTQIEHIGPRCSPAQGPCVVQERFANNLTAGAGVAVDASDHSVLAADTAAGIVRVYAVALEAETEEATEVLTTTATLNGSVNPAGTEVEGCQFEYGTTTEYGETAPCADPVGAGNAPVPVHAALTGLQGGTTYHARLTARDASGVVHGEDIQFTTATVAVVESASAVSVAAASAELTAKVNPHGLAATYRFEWGTTTAYDHVVPVPDGELGAGEVGKTVSQLISGLSAGTTYHWRLVVENVDGPTVTPDHTFVYEQSGVVLPDNRQYELVTAGKKNGALVGALFLHNTPPQVSDDGSRLLAPTVQCFNQATGCVGVRGSEGEPYDFSRTASGWTGQSLGPPATLFSTHSWWAINANTDSALFSAPTGAEDAEAFYKRVGAGAFEPIGPFGEGFERTSYIALRDEGLVATADLSHMVYETKSPQWPFDEGLANATSLYAYGSGEASAPAMVGVSGGPGSTDLISECGTTLGQADEGARKRYGSLADDGAIVYFSASPCESGTGTNAGVKVPAWQLFGRAEADRTIAISAPTAASCKSVGCTGATPGDAAFEGASADGSTVVFTDTHQLTDAASDDGNPQDSAVVSTCAGTTASESGCNLYESYCPGHCAAASERVLVDASAGADATGGPRVQGVMALAADGSRTYFVAKGVLTASPNAQGQKARDGQPNLYVYERGPGGVETQPVFIATLAQSDQAEWTTGLGTANVTPDGHFLVFTSHHALTPDDTRTEGPAQVFEYDATTQQLTRLSIGRLGFNDNGNAGSGNARITGFDSLQATVPERANPTMSNDGQYVFFASPIGLAPGALNDVSTEPGVEAGNFAENIYEYHDGTVSLISDGKDTAQPNRVANAAVELLGTDATGANVFFSTTDELLPADTDTQRDYYDARICTASDACIPSSQASEQACRESGCHGPASSPPGTLSPGSATVTGTEPPAIAPKPAVKKPPPPTRAQKLVKALKVCQQKRNRSKRKACRALAERRYGKHVAKRATRARPSRHSRKRGR